MGITGGTGFVGTHIANYLLEKGYRVIIFTRSVKPSRNENYTYVHWDVEKAECDIEALSSLDAVIHLAGAGIAEKRWTSKRKNEIVDSRINGTRFLVLQLKLHAPQCQTFIGTSAIGFYGPDRDKLFPFKEDAPAYTDFLGNTCKAWEHETKTATNFMRTVILRFGIVLGKEAGAFPRFSGSTRFGIVPILSSGKQIISWIHIKDICKLISFCLENNKIHGIYNAVTPYAISNKTLMHTIAKIKGGIKIPLYVPAFILKMMLGEMSIEILKSCTVSAEKTLNTGFIFQYPNINDSIKELLNK